jgi:sugar phosphate isomerase/epimerase
MYLTGFADEAADDIIRQIKVTKSLGWENIEARTVSGKIISNLNDNEFQYMEQELEKGQIKVNCLASTIANWQKTLHSPLEDDLIEVRRIIPRMKKLKTNMVRIMSYAPLRDKKGDILEDQQEEEIFRRLNIICQMFAEEGILPVHENCMTYGGMSWQNTLKLLKHVPLLKLVFDTGNPVALAAECGEKDRAHLDRISWDFYQHVREKIVYVHIKDVFYDAENQRITYTYPGEGQANIRKIVADLFKHGYDGGLSIEPHIEVVFHDPSQKSTKQARFENYVNYGHRLMKLLRNIPRE